MQAIELPVVQRQQDMIYLNRRSLPAPKGHELRGEDMKPVVNRFLKYASIDTQGNESVLTCPSNENQRFLAELLKDELEEICFYAG